ncbi:MAG: hypothetical protein NTV34_17305, partial [Proteobacteria bacterium]|nr:hypothetical protein [Pseudomonadota bacterium]
MSEHKQLYCTTLRNPRRGQDPTNFPSPMSTFSNAHRPELRSRSEKLPSACEGNLDAVEHNAEMDW